MPLSPFPSPSPSPVRLVALLLGAELLTMLGVFAFPALLPTFFEVWQLSNTEAGWISGIYFAGYTLSVPFLMRLTDRVDAKRVYMAGAAVTALFAQGYKNLFAVLSTSEQYLTEAIALAVKQAEKDGRDPKSIKVAMAMENDPFSQDVRLGLVDDIKKFGLNLIIDDKLPPDLSDMSATLNKVRALKPDILLVSGHSKGAALVTRQMAEMRVSVPMLAITHCESAKVTDTDKFGTNAEGTLCAAQWAPSMAYSGEWFGTAAEYTATFEGEYGYVPPYQAAESTAAVLVFVDAIRRAQSTDPDKVREALAATDLNTFYGDVKFSAVGNNIAKPMILRQIQNGKYVPVAPSQFVDGEMIFPRPGT